MAKVSVYLRDDDLEEIRQEAERLDRSVSYLVQRAWAMSKREIRCAPAAPGKEEQNVDDN